MTMTEAAVKKMPVREVAEKVIGREPLFILDVRHEEEFRNWRIEGERIEAVNIPYFDLLDGVDTALEILPDDRPVLVVCAKEGSAQFIAERLAEAGGRSLSYMEGGMKAWSEYLRPVKIADLGGGGQLVQFVRLGKGCLSYMVASGGEAAIIDANRMMAPYEEWMAEQGVRLRHVLDTHLHADHISGGRALALQFGADYYLPAADASEVTYHYNTLTEQQSLSVGESSIAIQPLYSPGHTIGSTSFIVDNQYLLTGDSLFVQSIGRPDLAGLEQDWAGDLRRTLYSRYKELSDDLLVLPAHYGHLSELDETGRVAGRLGDIYRNNPGLHIEDEEQFRRAVTENLPPQPNAYGEIRLTNMGRLSPSEEEQREMEAGPNRCAVHDK